MFTKKFLFDALERAVKTFAQTLLALITTVVAGQGTLGEVNWMGALSIATLATIFSFLTSLASSSAKSSDSASLVE